MLVNGRSAGSVYAVPYTVDVTEWFVAGRNRVEVKVVGSNYNLKGPLHAAHFKRITPAFWRGVKEYPSGKDYVQQDYGLMGDFTLAAGRCPLFRTNLRCGTAECRPAFRPVSFAIVGRYVREEGDFDIRKGGRLEEMSVSL